MLERERYLAQVEQGLPFNQAERLLVLEELDQHIEDTIAALEAAGMEPAAALRVALDGLGPSAVLADELARSHRTSRRRLSAAAPWLGLVVIASALALGGVVIGLAAVGAGHGLPGSEPTLVAAVARLVSNPSFVFLLWAAGCAGLILEVVHPNLATGLIGAGAVVAAWFGSSGLPINGASVALLALAIFMLLVEGHTPSHGVLAAGGAVAYLVAAATFYGPPAAGQHASGVAWPVTLGSGGLVLAFSLVVVQAAVGARHLPALDLSPGLAYSGTGIIGALGEVRRTLAPTGTVFVAGEAWSATSRGRAPIARGTRVRVLEQGGLVLLVEPVGGQIRQ